MNKGRKAIEDIIGAISNIDSQDPKPMDKL